MGGRVTGIALAISLIINVFILGAVVGGGAAGLRIVDKNAIASARTATALPPLPADPRRIMRDLPRERQKELRRVLGRNLVGLRPYAEEVRAARQDLFAAMSSETIDVAALREASAKASEKEALLRAKTNAAFAEFLIALTPEERAELQKRMMERKNRRGDPRRGGPEGQRGSAPPPGP